MTEPQDAPKFNWTLGQIREMNLNRMRLRDAGLRLVRPL